MEISPRFRPAPGPQIPMTTKRICSSTAREFRCSTNRRRTPTGDSFVFFRRSDVVSAGDIFVTTGYPIIDLARGGSLQGIIDALNRLIALTIPAGKVEGGTMVIPGHGRLCDQADVVYYQEMVTILRDRIRDMIKKGLTLEQVKAARPTRDYDPVYGSTNGFWTTDMFVEAAYKSLGGK